MEAEEEEESVMLDEPMEDEFGASRVVEDTDLPHPAPPGLDRKDKVELIGEDPWESEGPGILE